MKTVAYLLTVLCLCAKMATAQVPSNVHINNITLPTTGISNGKFTVTVSPAQTPAIFESSIDGGTTWYQHTNAGITYNNKPAGMYRVQVRKIGTTELLTNRRFILRSEYNANFTTTAISATACNTNNGKIKIGGILATDSVSWISSITPSFTVASALQNDTIIGLKPGMYYIIVKKAGNNYAFSTKTINVGNAGVACPTPTYCGNAQGDNLFPNGTFGSGASVNGAALPENETTYGYSQLASSSPNDGFYTISNTSDYNGAASGGNIFGVWSLTSDHTGNPNGYMMIVNASYDKDIVTEKVITGLCPNKTYQFSAFLKNLLPSANYIQPNVTLLIDGVGQYTSGDITTGDWKQVGFTFKTTGTSAKFSIRNNNPGGSGNDWAIDDIFVGTCAPTVSLQPIIATCENPPTEATATVTDIARLYDTYQWQVNKNDGNGYQNIGTTQTGTFDTANKYTATLTLPSPLTPLNNGWRYRLVAGTSPDDLSGEGCAYMNTQILAFQECGGVVLPIKMLGIKAVKTNNGGMVLWQVAEQQHVKRYELEKSTDGRSYSIIGVVMAKTSNAPVLDYYGEDLNLSNGINYYRVKIVDMDGKYAYSQVVTLVIKGSTSAIRIFPNPATDRLFIWMPTGSQVKQYQIFDAAGRMVMQQSTLGNNTNVTDVTIQHLSTGFYTLRLFNENYEVSNHRFIKK